VHGIASTFGDLDLSTSLIGPRSIPTFIAPADEFGPRHETRAWPGRIHGEVANT
jgi:hypothetical protein